MHPSKPPTIFFCVGEPSGDLHGANLIRQLQARCPGFVAVGYGGPKMAEAGCQLHADLTALAVMWFARVLVNLHKFWGLVSRADRYFRHHKPDAVVLIDYPGLNWWIARRAKVHGIPVFYYTPPQIWAWARWRVKKMRRLVDHVLCSLPFEEAWFRRHGCNATFVGHPFFDEVRRYPYDEQFIAEHGSQAGPLVLILPGSRMQEVTHNLRWFLKAAALIREKVPHVRFALASFKPHQAEVARKMIDAVQGIPNRLPIEIYVGKTPELMRLADCAMSVSGSVSLELLYHTTPTVILYWIDRFAYFVQGYFRKVKYITLVNLLSVGDRWEEEERSGLRGQRSEDGGSLSNIQHSTSNIVLFPEYLTYEDKSAELAGHIVQWLTDPASRAARVEALRELKARVAHGGASQRAAEYILEKMMNAE
jgi:lipid-A-disaccharide synthase